MKRLLTILLTLSSIYPSFSQKPTPSDLRGPIQSDQFEIDQSSVGVQVRNLKYQPLPARPSSLPVPWIWLDPIRFYQTQNTRTPGLGKGNESGPRAIDFKKIFTIDGPVEQADIRISADIRYRLFINGKLISRGPANIGTDVVDSLYPRHWLYDDFQSRAAFKQGTNSIAIEVFTRDNTWSATTMGRGGVFMEAAIHLKSGVTQNISTDNTWLGAPSLGYRPNGGFDAAREAADWITTSSYPQAWSHAVSLPDSITSIWAIQQSQLPQMMEKRILPIATKFPLIIKASPKPQRIRLEFDNLYTGYLGLKVSAKAGVRIQLTTAELENGEAQTMTYKTTDGLQTYESPFLMDGKYVYVNITNPTADLTIEDISMVSSGFPVSYAGDFTCSDPFLNALWRNIRWVTQMNMQTYHMDSPLHQEPTGDAGDYLIESLVNYYAFGSSALARQDLKKIALVMQKKDYQMFHTSYMLLWLQMLTSYYQYTGDETLVKELAPDVYRLMDRFHSYIGANGIITDAPNYMFMDWGSIANIQFHHPPANLGQGYMTAFYYKGLQEACKIATWAGDSQKANKFTHEASVLKQSFISNLYDPNKKLFKSGLDHATHITPHAWMTPDTTIAQELPYVNVLALLYGLAPDTARTNILQFILGQHQSPISPYFMYFVFDAITSQHVFDSKGFEEMRRWRVLSEAPVGLREGWAMGDYSHAWGGSPAYYLSSKVLGVSPAKPGYKEVLIEPHPGDLDSASGIVPTPQGPVNISWHRTKEAFIIEVHTPEKMPINFSLPAYKGSTTDNDHSIDGSIDQEGRIHFTTEGGDHKVEITAAVAEVKMDNVSIEPGPFQPDWKQVGDKYKTPAWFNEAKFGIWIHWGPQAMGESGDWFAKFMYCPFGDDTHNGAYENHIKKWGHPSDKGYKDMLPHWHAAHWNPEKIIKLYKEAGARYVLILGTHHDNFDNWNSHYQAWNSVNIGPHKDIVGGWIKAAKEQGLRYGITFHADYTWWWWQPAFTADSTGKYKGIPYDGAQAYNKDTVWWKGMNLQDLYGKDLRAERPQGRDPRNDFYSFMPERLKDTAYARWYCTRWCNRVKDLVDQYQPDILYFDGNTYPFSGTGTGRGFKSDAAIRMAAHYYNSNIKKNNGDLQALLFTKGNEDPRAVSTTHESNVPDSVTDPNAWMSENSIGEWFYKPGLYYSTPMVLHQMIEAFAKGGNYTVNFPIDADGDLDPAGITTLKEIGQWMNRNGEAVYGSTAWKVWGEGATRMPEGNLRKEQDVKYTPEDIRFTTHNGKVYAFLMARPVSGKILIKSLAQGAQADSRPIKSVSLLGTAASLKWLQSADGLEIFLPSGSAALFPKVSGATSDQYPLVFGISF